MIEVMANSIDVDSISVAVHCKQTLRDEIQNQVDAFLKKGGKIEPLDFGYTCFKDGNIPINRSISRNQKPEASTDVLQSKASAVAPSQRKQLRTQSKVIKKVPDKKLIEKRERRKKINELKEESIASGLKEFIGPCATHNETRYVIRANGVARCALCAEASKYHNLDLETRLANKARKEFNQKQLKEAIAINKEEFIGSCINCGNVPFKIRTLKNKKDNGSLVTYNYACIACFKKSVRLSDIKRRDRKRNS